MSYVGKCHGGPLDGQMLAHWAKSQKYFRPMVGFSMNPEGTPVEAVEIGEYRLNDFGQWHWWKTARAAGAADRG